MLQRNPPQVAVLDIGLPGIDGFEVVRRLRARGGTTPVLLLTARDAIEDRVRGLELGADDYLVKPFATPELVARIRALARRNAAEDQHPARWATWSGRRRRAAPASASARWNCRRANGRCSNTCCSRRAGWCRSSRSSTPSLPWGEDLTLNAVEVYVSRLRLKLDGAGLALRTIRGFGYMLEAAPHEQPPRHPEYPIAAAEMAGRPDPGRQPGRRRADLSAGLDPGPACFRRRFAHECGCLGSPRACRRSARAVERPADDGAGEASWVALHDGQGRLIAGSAQLDGAPRAGMRDAI